QTAQHLGQFVLAAINSEARTADALDAVDDGTAVVILEFDGQRALRAGAVDTEVRDIAFGLQDLENGHLQLRGAHAHGRLAGGLRIANAGQEICNWISHAHSARLTNSPSKGLESRRDWPLRAAWCAQAQICGTPRVS